jgi:hypothetical protein
MNSEFLRWLLNIERIPADAETVRLIFERPFPAWLWAIIVMVGGLFAIWSYSRLTGWRPGRGALAGLRFAIILLVCVLISGPMLEMPRESVEEDWVLVLADRSASMQIADVEASGLSPTGRITRDEQLRRALGDHADVFEFLDDQKELVWLGFHMGAFTLSARADTSRNESANGFESNGADFERFDIPVDLGEADGRRTSIGTAIEQALQRAAARPLSGIVLLSDGRTNDPPSRALIRRLQQDAVAVFTVPLGSREPLADLAIRRVDSPRRAFIRDKVPIVVQLDRMGEAARDLGATVRLIDEMTGEELASEVVSAGDDRDELTLTAEPDMAGDTTWRVEIETDQPTLVPDRLVATFPIELIDRPLRVLYVDGYPRWEYRYVKNLLVREQSIESSIMLLSADRGFAQEGDKPIARLPRSPGEFGEFDVVVLGDVPGSFFTHDQLEMIRDLVAERGAGLLWIAGERYMPRTLAGTPLADLLPVRGSLDLAIIGRPVLMEPTPQAERLGVLNLATPEQVGWPRELVDPDFGWSKLHWAQRLDPTQLKPTVEVLARTTEYVGDQQLPLVTLMRYGAGRTIYVATDEVWRWRYGRGELLPEQFWVQMIRMLGRESVTSDDDLALLEVNPRRVQTGQPIRIDLRLLDTRLAEMQLDRVDALLETESGVILTELQLSRLDTAEARFAATFLTDTPGRLRVRLAEPALHELRLEGEVYVYLPDDELRQPETDHDLLRQLAESTGGIMIEPDNLRILPESLPNRAVTISNPLTERIWDTPFFFGLIVLLLTLEWVGRKVVRLI